MAGRIFLEWGVFYGNTCLLACFFDFVQSFDLIKKTLAGTRALPQLLPV